MYTIEKIKKDIVSQINKAVGKKVITVADLVYPPKPDFGDISLPCFNKSKIGLSVQDLFAQLSKKSSSVLSINLTGAYLNFKINRQTLVKRVLPEISKEKNKYGQNKNGQGKKVMVEYSNANTHKEYHVGHLRNICYGDAVSRILSVNGYKVIPVSYINDFGIHVAKTLWQYLKNYQDKKTPENKGRFLGEIYARAVADMTKDKMAQDMVIFLMKKIEGRQGQEYKLWQETRRWSIDGFAKIYNELGIKFEHTFYESEYIDKGKDLVAKLYKNNILKRSEGAVIADLSVNNLGVLVLIRSDGTALYPVADLALAEEKFKKYKLDKSIYVVDIRQTLYFKQLYELLRQAGFKQELVHLGYEFVKLPSGMMSSRLGNVITYEDLHERILDKAVTETSKRHPDWAKNKIKATAGKIAIGAMKYEMITVSAQQVINFDIEKALRFEGFTAGYLQYVCARINSIIRKRKVKSAKLKVDFNNLGETKEAELIMKLAKYPEIVTKAEVNYDPSEIAKYLFDLGQLFSDYYQTVPILKAEEKIMFVRLALIAAVRQVIANGLDLLGIEIINEM